MNGVFISYRRSDSGGHAGRIHDRLVDYYGPARVFRDIDDIAAGDDFLQTIRDTLSSQDVLLVIIGPTWLTVTDEMGARRLDNPNDVVRLEIAEALKQPHTRVIPVLVGGASMPRANDLTGPLAPLAVRNAFEVSETRFADDVSRLIETIGGARRGRFRKAALVGGLTLITLAASAVLLKTMLTPAPKVAADITLFGGEGTVAGNANDAVTALSVADTATVQSRRVPMSRLESPFTVSYEFRRKNKDDISIMAVLPYRDLLLNGGPIANGGSILWDWPRLSVQIVNNSDETRYISGVEIEVTESNIDTEPLMIVRERLDQSDAFDVLNQGWGDAVSPTMEVGVVEASRCSDQVWLDVPRTSVPLETAALFRPPTMEGNGPPTFGGAGVTARVDVHQLVPPQLQSMDPVQEGPLCALGVLRYLTQAGDERSVRFKTRLRVYGQTALSSINPSSEHHVFLEAGKGGYTKPIAIDYEVQPHGVEHFLLRVGTDKSASFNMTINLRSVGSEDLLLADVVQLSVLTPVTDSELRRSPTIRTNQ